MDKQLTENEAKKQYLREYREHVRRIHRIEEEIRELRLMKTCPTVNNDGMPRGSNKSDLSGYVAEIDGMIRELQDEHYWRIKSYKEIVKRIKELRSENEIDVLFYRYIKGMDWWEIADKMNYTERWIHKIHGKALAHFELPKEFIEVH